MGKSARFKTALQIGIVLDNASGITMIELADFRVLVVCESNHHIVIHVHLPRRVESTITHLPYLEKD